MRDGFGEEESTCITRRGLVVHIQEQVRVSLVKEVERRACEARDDRLKRGVDQGDDSDQRHAREQSTPCDIPERVLDLVDAPRSASEEEELDIVDDEWDGLEVSSGGPGKTLKEDVGDEESRGGRKVLCKESGSRRRVFDQSRKSLDETAG